MNSILRTLDLNSSSTPSLYSTEWLVTNGIGGYACGTIDGCLTRRYHGLLIAALGAPLGRTVMLNGMKETASVTGTSETVITIPAANDALPGLDEAVLEEFGLENGLPFWRYRINEVTLEKRIFMLTGRNTTFIRYLVQGTAPLQLKIEPAVNFRTHDADVSQALSNSYEARSLDCGLEITNQDGFHPLYLAVRQQSYRFHPAPTTLEAAYPIERGRGYAASGPLFLPGAIDLTIAPGEAATLIVSAEPWDQICELDAASCYERENHRRLSMIERSDPSLHRGLAAELILAADQFVIVPQRIHSVAHETEAHHEVQDRTVLAGYHWFTDWGRDTMISLEGLTLSTGRYAEAKRILITFSHHVKDGLIPNLFPEHGREGLYHTADATLWYVHAIHRYLKYTGDRETLRLLLPKLLEIVDAHMRGTHFGIGVDPQDGLLTQGQEGYQLTWMDAKVGDWVVTPRRGKAVEINALWYNALCLISGWLQAEGQHEQANEIAQTAAHARTSFNKRFWYDEGKFLYDVVDGPHGDSLEFRPNQLFAISLDNPILNRNRWKPVFDAVGEKLLTPVGLRTLAPGSEHYHSNYDGDLLARDAAYHQGTVWPWLIGPFVDVWLKLNPQGHTAARNYLTALEPYMNTAAVGTLSEIYDAEEPYTARGCVSQAWSVAEVLRAWHLTAPEGNPEAA